MQMKWFGRNLQIAALPLLALLFIALVSLSALLFRGARLDLTENRQYTLSPGTVRILQRIPEPIKLELYYSEKAAQTQPQFRVYAQRVRELLEEMVAHSNGKLSLGVVDPEPFSDAEDRATSHELRGVPLGSSGQTLYFGLVGSNSTDGESVMPFIQPSKEAFVEYDVARMVSALSGAGKPVLAVLSELPMAPGIDPLTGQATPGWVMDRQLPEYLEVRRLQANPASIGDDVDLLMLVHPKAVSEDTEYAIDQFVLRGGRLLVFVDPDAESDPAANVLEPQLVSRSSNLPLLFKAWGLGYDPTKVVLDSQNAMQFQPDPAKPPARHLAVLGLGEKSMNQRDVITSGLESINLSSAGALALDAGSALSFEALLQSSSNAMLADVQTVRAAAEDPSVLEQEFKADGAGPYVLSGRLTGKLASAFPGRIGARHRAASTGPVNILVVADTDLLSDRMWVQVQNFLGQPLVNAFANNADFVYNAVDNLTGNDDLIAVRTRPAADRPFERIDVVRRGAEERYKVKERQLQQQLEEVEQKLSRLQPITADGQAPALSQEQQEQLLQFQQQKLATRKELRAVQHRLNADIKAIGDRIKVINILGMPLLVILVAIAIAWRRRLRRRDLEP